MYDLLIHNARVVTVNASREIVPDGLIGIRGDVIAYLAPRAAGQPLPPAGEVIDAAGGIVLPGLVNAHTHLPMTLFRGLADDLPLKTWFEAHIFPAEATHITPDTVYWGTRLACAELLLSGVTTCCDGYFLEDVVARAVQRTGMRAVLGHGIIDFPAPGVPDPAANVRTAAAYVRDWRNRTPLIHPAVFCHAPYTCSERTLSDAKEAAVAEGVLFQIHLAETRDEKPLPGDGDPAETSTARLARLGVLDERTLLVHGVWLTPEDVAAVAQSGAGIVHCPESNMKLASGIAPVPTFLEAGIPVGLGTDGCASNNDQDLLREMDTAAKLHKAAGGDPTLLPAEEVLAMATRWGAKAIGLGDRIGSIEVGKQADIVVLDSAHPALCPLYHPVSQTVYAASGDAVRDTIVAGRVRVRNRRLEDGDLAEVIANVNRIARRIENASGKGQGP